MKTYRERLRGSLLSATLVLALLALAPFEAARADQVLVFDILRDGAEIGEQRVEIAGNEVHVTQEIEVKALFLTLYSRSHERRETWADGRIVALTAETDDDGDLYTLWIRAEGDGYQREVNGKTESFDSSYGFVPDWSLASAGRPKAFSAQTDEIFDPLYLERIGTATVELPSGRYETERWQASDGFERDLWYDAQGHLVRMLFESRGSEIEYRRR